MALEKYLDRHNMPAFSGNTQLMIVPGYKFRLVDAMITNFHMPQEHVTFAGCCIYR